MKNDEKIAVCFCLDTSSSVLGSAIDRLNAGIKLFFRKLRTHKSAWQKIDTAIITFGGRGIKCERDFSDSGIINQIPLSTGGMTLLGEAVDFSVNMIEDRLDDYYEMGLKASTSWLIITSDGWFNGDPAVLRSVIERINIMTAKRELTIFTIGIGNEINLENLRPLSPTRMPIMLKDFDFKNMFDWFSDNLIITAVSTQGANINFTSTNSWGYIVRI